MLDNKKIGRFIANKRKEVGLTQQQIAETLNISYQAISKWENGLAYPNIELLYKLAHLLDVSVDELLSANEVELETNQEVYDFYRAGAEIGRLERGLGKIEFMRTKELIMRYFVFFYMKKSV